MFVDKKEEIYERTLLADKMMKRFNVVFTFLLVGIMAINISPLAFGQGVTVEISGNKANIAIPEIANTTIIAVDVSDSLDFPVRNIEINSKQPIDIAEFTIELMDSTSEGSEEVNGTVHQYLTIDTNLTSEDVTYIKISFGVPNSWISSNDIDKTIVRLVSTNSEGGWDVILTEILEETEDETIFVAPLINLGADNYAIAEIPPWVATTTYTQIQTKTTTITTDTATVTSTVAGNTVVVTSVVGGSSTMSYLAIGGAVAALGILALVFKTKKRK